MNAEHYFRQTKRQPRVVGGIAGVASLFFMGAIYARLGSREGRGLARTRVLHVLAYGGVPVAASLMVTFLDPDVA